MKAIVLLFIFNYMTTITNSKPPIGPDDITSTLPPGIICLWSANSGPLLCWQPFARLPTIESPIELKCSWKLLTKYPTRQRKTMDSEKRYDLTTSLSLLWCLCSTLIVCAASVYIRILLRPQDWSMRSPFALRTLACQFSCTSSMTIVEPCPVWPGP